MFCRYVSSPLGQSAIERYQQKVREAAKSGGESTGQAGILVTPADRAGHLG